MCSIIDAMARPLGLSAWAAPLGEGRKRCQTLFATLDLGIDLSQEIGRAGLSPTRRRAFGVPLTGLTPAVAEARQFLERLAQQNVDLGVRGVGQVEVRLFRIP